VAMQPEVAATATSTAVSNMIIKAAADFITTQEQEQHHYHHHGRVHSHSPQAAVGVSGNPAETASDPLVNLLLNHSNTPETAAAVAAAAAVAVQPPIPQELTTMSDQDLISYINPSTFDQREFYRLSLRVSMDG